MSLSPEQWSRAKGLFLQARQLESGERSDFLAEACGGEGSLRDEVESLLKHGSQAQQEGFLAEPVVRVDLAGTDEAVENESAAAESVCQDGEVVPPSTCSVEEGGDS